MSDDPQLALSHQSLFNNYNLQLGANQFPDPIFFTILLLLSKNLGPSVIQQLVKHHPEPWRGEPMAEGCRLDRGMPPVGVVSMDKLRTSFNDDEMKIILRRKEWGDGAKSMYKLGSVGTSYNHVYTVSTNICNSTIYMKYN